MGSLAPIPCLHLVLKGWRRTGCLPCGSSFACFSRSVVATWRPVIESRKGLRLRAWHDQERFQENWGRESWLTSRVNQFVD